MSYKIDIQHKNGIFISFFGVEVLRGEEFDQYLRDVIDVNIMFDRAGHTQVYHILVIESTRLDFEAMLRTLTITRQNKQIVALRNRLHSLSMIVSQSPVVTKFIETMLSNPDYGGRRLMLFPTVEAALAFIRFEQSQQRDAVDDSSTHQRDQTPNVSP